MKSINGRRTGPWLLLVLLACPVCGQFKPFDPTPKPAPERPSARPQQPPTFSVGVSLVRLLVSVRDNSGAIKSGLNREDFRILDSGIAQDVALFERNTSVPLSVAVLIDTSGSTMKDLHYEVDSVLKFLPALLRDGNPEDTFAIYSFNWRTNLEADFSRSKQRAEHVLRALHGDGGTSLYDSIYLASNELAGREGRHVMVVVTDGGDTTSYKRFNDALKAAQRADAVLYPIVVIPVANDAGRNTGGEHALATLATSTGGRIFNPEGFEELDNAFSDILRELRTQYLVGFYPKNVRQEPSLFHPVKIELRDSTLKVSARSGYYEP